MSDGFKPQCKLCTKKHYLDNREKKKEYYLENKDRIKQYYLENRDKNNVHEKNYRNKRSKTDINFRLIKNTRKRIYKSLKGMTKQSFTLDILGIDFDLYKKWIEFQFTPDMNWSNIEIDHVKVICLFVISKDKELKEAFNWKNTQPLLKHDHQQKGIKINFLDYPNQFIKAYQFIKLNEERSNENIR